MVKIAASVLACDFSKAGDECRHVLDSGTDWLHYDVMDGVFVPNLSLGIGELKSLHQAVEAFYDVHLMITDPLPYIAAFCEAGAGMITFHVESQSDPNEVVRAIRKGGAMVGVCVKPKTPAKEIFPYLPLVDMVLIMAVEPGFGGQKFIKEAVSKIQEVKREITRIKRDVLIEVDGGINAETARAAVLAGADILVAGSAVFGQADRRSAIAALQTACAGQAR